MQVVQKPQICVVVPNRPPIDKYIAAKRVHLDLEPFFRIRVAFCDVNDPTPGHYKEWQEMCSPGREPILIDVGRDGKYHKWFRSAAEMEKLASSVEGSKTWNYLVELANRNNETGELKQHRHSVAKLVREIYHVMNSGLSSQEVVWEHCMDVVDSFFWHTDKRDWGSLFTNNSLYGGLHELWEGFGVKEEEVLPFTLPFYFRKLFTSGRSENEIIAKISWWLDKARRVQTHQAVAQKQQYQINRFRISGRNAGLVHIKDFFEAGAFSYQWIGSGKLALGVIRSWLGHVHIQPSFRHPGADLSALYDILSKLEPTQWYYEKRFKAGEMLMNGSWQFTGVKPSALSDSQLIHHVYQHVRWK